MKTLRCLISLLIIQHEVEIFIDQLITSATILLASASILEPSHLPEAFKASCGMSWSLQIERARPSRTWKMQKIAI